MLARHVFYPSMMAVESATIAIRPEEASEEVPRDEARLRVAQRLSVHDIRGRHECQRDLSAKGNCRSA
jgi:hypothetical protein